MALEEPLNILAVTRARLPIPEVMDRRALEDGEKLTDDPPGECHGAHCIQGPLEPDLGGQFGSVLGEDARVEEEDGEFDHGDRGGVEVFEDVEHEVPFLGRVGAGHGLVLAKVEMGRWA